ncbi:MAG: diguanylate cyclase domain-containing protein, partial [Acidimicrobiales bacterium]
RRFTDAMLETIEVGIVSCDADGVLVVGNRAERQMFALDAGIDGQPMNYLDERIDVYDGGQRLEPDEYPLMRALRGEDVSRIEVLAGPAGGPYRELEVRGRQITGGGGEVLGAVAALTDVTAERVAQRELAAEHRRLAEAQRLGNLGSFELDVAGDRWTFSDHLCVLWGLEPGTVDATRIHDLIVEEDRPRILDCWRSACRDGGIAGTDVRITRAGDGAERLIRVNLEVELAEDGRPVQVRGTHLDVTDLDAAETAAQRANAFFGAVMSATPDHTFVTDLSDGRVIYASPGKEVLGLASEELATLGLDEMVALAHPDDRQALEQATVAAVDLGDGEVGTVQYRARHADGRWRWLSQRMTPFRRDGAARVVEVLAVVRDTTEVVEAHERLVHAARHDYLTGLPNRSLLVERLEAALRQAERERREIAVLFCDLDGFKEVNDAGGHAAGDAVLAQVAQRMVAVVRDRDVVARVGGDEFVIIVEPWNRSIAGDGDAPAPGAPARWLARHVADRVVEALRRPFVVDGATFPVTVSIGIAHADPARMSGARPALTADLVLYRADMAMYRAKERGKDQVGVFDL